MRIVVSLALVACGLALVLVSFDAAGGTGRDRTEGLTGWQALCWPGLALVVVGVGLALVWTVRRPRPPKVGAFAALVAMSLASLYVTFALTFEWCAGSLGCVPEAPDAFTRASDVLLAIGLGLVPVGAMARFAVWCWETEKSTWPS
jgi:hypothetical protein